MRLSADVAIMANGELRRDVTVTVVDGLITDISNGIDGNAAHYAVITPMFHNGHSHIEYQLLSGILPSSSFFTWVRNVVRLKSCIPTRFWAVSTFYGAAKLLEMGYASSEDCCDSGFATATMSALGLRGTSYREVNGLISDVDTVRCESRIDELHQWWGSLPVGVAPHAIYSTCQPVLEVVLNQADGLPLCIHVDESPDEDLFCRNNNGPFVEMYIRRGIEHRSPRTSAIQYFDTLGLVTPRTLLVHGCNWTSEDVAIVKSRESRVAVCPESNQFLHCKLPPVESLYRSGITTVIGTDSGLSCASMSPMNQLRILMNTSTDPQFHQWLFRAQVTPESGKSYELRVGESADFCAYGHGKTVIGKTLFETIHQIANETPDVYRSGHRINSAPKLSSQSELANVVKELATA